MIPDEIKLPLKIGDVGPAVWTLQRAMRDREPDGTFGLPTLIAVRDLQRTYRLPITGVVDAATWEAIREDGAL